MALNEVLASLRVDLAAHRGADLPVRSPIDGAELAVLKADDEASLNRKIMASVAAFREWENVPAPVRGHLVRILGNVIRENVDALQELVTLEVGKIPSESRGEVIEMTDMFDMAQGLSNQLYGRTIPSERPRHILVEGFDPLGPVGVITAFNFPVAVWAWNAGLALICGDSIVWKPSEKTPLCALAVQSLFEQACERFTKETGVSVPSGLSQIILGKGDIGQAMVDDDCIPLISFTGSEKVGRQVYVSVAQRMGKPPILELGGNNGAIVMPSANLQDVALPAILFAAFGTAGQRCTTLRRLIVHEDVADKLVEGLRRSHEQFFPAKVGDPRREGVLVGPLIDKRAFDAMQAALRQAEAEGGVVIFGGDRVPVEQYPDAYYVNPAIVKMPSQTKIMGEETFAPILYVVTCRDIEEAVAMNNAVRQGLSSSIFTTDTDERAYFRRHTRSGGVHVNAGTSGAEVRGAFGGNWSTGWGREAGDNWQQYMLRKGGVDNDSGQVKLAQGITLPGLVER